jgi:PPIC-type PPIASE domain
MKYCILCLVAIFLLGNARGQSIAQMKAEMEKSANPVALVKTKYKKKFKIDTIGIMKLNYFRSMADSIAYHGKVGKVYGPFPEEKILVQILGKANNQFYRVSQIFIDTAVFPRKFADSIAKSIITKITTKESNWEDMSMTYTMDGMSNTGGDIGWSARGSMIPSLEKEILKRKKGDIFKINAPGGVYIIKITEKPKQDIGFALMLRVIL